MTVIFLSSMSDNFYQMKQSCHRALSGLSLAALMLFFFLPIP